jgi:DNA-binding PadR family transcriptional regulator
MPGATEATTESHLPLNPRAYAILLVIADGPAHGYRIKREVEERSAGTIELDPGSLYRTIAKMVRDGMVKEGPAPRDADRADVRRRYYRLTPLGRRVAQAETRRLAALIETQPARALLRRS